MDADSTNVRSTFPAVPRWLASMPRSWSASSASARAPITSGAALPRARATALTNVARIPPLGARRPLPGAQGRRVLLRPLRLPPRTTRWSPASSAAAIRRDDRPRERQERAHLGLAHRGRRHPRLLIGASESLALPATARPRRGHRDRGGGIFWRSCASSESRQPPPARGPYARLVDGTRYAFGVENTGGAARRFGGLPVRRRGPAAAVQSAQSRSVRLVDPFGGLQAPSPRRSSHEASTTSTRSSALDNSAYTDGTTRSSPTAEPPGIPVEICSSFPRVYTGRQAGRHRWPVELRRRRRAAQPGALTNCATQAPPACSHGACIGGS